MTEPATGEAQASAGIIVAAYCKHYAVAGHGERPSGEYIGRLGKLAKAMLEEGANWVILEQCAQEVGAFDRHPDHLRDAYERKVDTIQNAEVHGKQDTAVLTRYEAEHGRITGWREVRGTHAVSYVPDPIGTARNPEAMPVRMADRTLAKLVRAQSELENSYDVNNTSNVVDLTDYV